MGKIDGARPRTPSRRLPPSLTRALAHAHSPGAPDVDQYEPAAGPTEAADTVASLAAELRAVQRRLDLLEEGGEAVADELQPPCSPPPTDAMEIEMHASAAPESDVQHRPRSTSSMIHVAAVRLVRAPWPEAPVAFVRRMDGPHLRHGPCRPSRSIARPTCTRPHRRFACRRSGFPPSLGTLLCCSPHLSQLILAFLPGQPQDSSARTKAAYLAGSWAVVLLQLLVAVGILISALSIACVDNSQCAAGWFCTRELLDALLLLDTACSLPPQPSSAPSLVF